MKKIIGIILVLSAAIIMVACGRPQDMSKETYDYGNRALEIIEKYNKAEISADDAKSRLESIQSYVEGLTFSNELEEIVNGTLTIILDRATFGLQHDTGDMIDVENSLKDYLGK